MINYQNVSLVSEKGDTILNNLNFQVKTGEFFVLVGSSGSGKTTTLKLYNRLINQSSGTITFENKNITDYSLRDLRLETGYVLQEIALFPNLTVGENIALILEMKKLDKVTIDKRTKELLEKVGLDPEKYINRLPDELSGGEKQRVGILRAIIAHPKVLLMDEPFSALDPLSRTQLQDLIKLLHNEYKMTVLFVTHDMHEALKLADRICVMDQGKIVQIGTPDEIKNHPTNMFVKDFFE